MILSKLMETPMNTNPVRTAATPASAKKNSCHSLICTLLLVVVACTDSGSVGTPSVDLAALVSCSALLDGCEVRGGRNLHEVVVPVLPFAGRIRARGGAGPQARVRCT